MRLYGFSVRTAKEILRDPLTLIFGLGFPLILIFLLSAIQANIPVALFEIERLAPGISVFGLSFMTLFGATLLARDRESALLSRLYTTPIRAHEFILGYALPLLPISLGQCVICYIAAIILGLTPTVGLVYALLFILPCSLFFISLGLFFGSIMGVKQVGGICGALVTNLTAWLSGVWFDLELVGGGFARFAELLPFVHAVKLEQAALTGELGGIWGHLAWVTGYTAAAAAAACLAFTRQMKK